MSNCILLINSHQLENKAISSGLTFNGYAVISEGNNSNRFQQMISAGKIDVLIDELSNRENLDFAKSARRINNQVGIVFISTIHDLRLFDISLEELPSRSKLIYKPNISSFEVILEAIISSKDLSGETEWINPPETEKSEELTDLQVETLRMVAAGFTNKEISKQAFVSEKAVEQRICRLANVLGITFSNGQNLRVKLTSHFVNWTNGRIEVKSK